MMHPTLCPACGAPAGDAHACAPPGAAASGDGADGALLARVRAALAPDFDVASEIGRGRSAVVYLARDRRLLHQVALKVLLPELAGADDVAERFLGAARATAMLEHPSIVPVYAAGERDGLRFVAMRYVDGRSLEHLLRAAPERRLPVPLACLVLADVARALDFAHDEGVTHGDLVPGNVLLDRRWGRALVTDFGGVPPAPGGAAPAAPAGVPAGAPADALAGARGADQHALGALAYRLLTGAPPPAGDVDGPTAPARDGRRAIRRANPACPIGLESAVLRMLAPTPEERWPRLGDVLAVLLRHVGSEAAQRKELQSRLEAPHGEAGHGRPPHRVEPEWVAPGPAVPGPPVASPVVPGPVVPRPVAPHPASPHPVPSERAVPDHVVPGPTAARPAGPVAVCDIELPFRDASFAPGPAATPARAVRSAGALPQPRRRLQPRALAGLAFLLGGTALAAAGVRRLGGGHAAARQSGAAERPAPRPDAPAPSAASPAPAPAADALAGLPAAVADTVDTAAAPAPDSAVAVRVVVERGGDTLAVGDSVRLRATLVGRDGAPLPRPVGERVRWRSGDASRVRVAPNGWVHATRAGGPVTVAATVGGASGRRRLLVVPRPEPASAPAPGEGEVRAAPAAPTLEEAEALVRTFVDALRGRQLDAVRRALAGGGVEHPEAAAEWLERRRDFQAGLLAIGAVRDSAGAPTMEFRVALAWRTRSLKDLHRGGTPQAADPWFRATFARGSTGWVLRGVAPVDRFPP